MNIKEYYSGMSRLYMHQTILCVIIFVVVILPSLKMTKFFPVISAGIFVVILAIYYFLRHLYFTYMSSIIPHPQQLNHQGSVLMIIPTPLSTYQWKLFTGSGLCRISIMRVKGRKKRKMKRLYPKCINIFQIVDHESNKKWIIYKERKAIHIHCNEYDSQYTAKVTNRHEYHLGNDFFNIKKTMYTYTVMKNDQKLMSISEGIMPINLQKIFHASTPIVTFYRPIKEHERYFCIALFTKYL